MNDDLRDQLRRSLDSSAAAAERGRRGLEPPNLRHHPSDPHRLRRALGATALAAILVVAALILVMSTRRAESRDQVAAGAPTTIAPGATSPLVDPFASQFEALGHRTAIPAVKPSGLRFVDLTVVDGNLQVLHVQQLGGNIAVCSSPCGNPAEVLRSFSLNEIEFTVVALPLGSTDKVTVSSEVRAFWAGVEFVDYRPVWLGPEWSSSRIGTDLSDSDGD